MFAPGQKICVVTEDDADLALVICLTLGVKWVLWRVWTNSCACSLTGIILDYLMWNCLHAQTGSYLSWDTGNVTRFCCQSFHQWQGFSAENRDHTPEARMYPLPARYSWTEILALCILASRPYPLRLHSSTTLHPCSCAKAPPLQTKEWAQHRQQWRVAGRQCPPTHQNTHPVNNSNNK